MSSAKQQPSSGGDSVRRSERNRQTAFTFISPLSGNLVIVYRFFLHAHILSSSSTRPAPHASDVDRHNAQKMWSIRDQSYKCCSVVSVTRRASDVPPRRHRTMHNAWPNSVKPRALVAASFWVFCLVLCQLFCGGGWRKIRSLGGVSCVGSRSCCAAYLPPCTYYPLLNNVHIHTLVSWQAANPREPC